MDRRKFLALGGLSLSAMLLEACDAKGAKASGLLRWAERRNEGVERGLFRGSSRDGPDTERLAGDAMPAYYISRPVPTWDAAARGVWALEVAGAVERPLRLTLADLAKLPRVTQRVNHYCVEGWTAVTEFTGVRVSTLARMAGLKPDAAYVDFESFDKGYHESWDLDSALHRQTLIAYAREGKPLGVRYGAPARLHSPVKLGYKSVKYLTRVVFLPRRNGGYWTDRGYEWFAGT
jgi:DMSO/TMAO reductase YedYZ molybdopterin-dependent catalytic subunit